jgi:hypothetical protein
MEYQGIVNLVVGGALLAVGWWCKEIWNSVKSLAKDVKSIEVDLPTNYVSKADIDARLDKIDMVLERIFDKLDAKVDK